MTKPPACFGTMFPDLARLEYNKPLKGTAFEVCVESCGIGVQRHQLKDDGAQWQRCLACASFRGCYDLGMAKLALYHALRH